MACCCPHTSTTAACQLTTALPPTCCDVSYAAPQVLQFCYMGPSLSVRPAGGLSEVCSSIVSAVYIKPFCQLELGRVIDPVHGLHALVVPAEEQQVGLLVVGARSRLGSVLTKVPQRLQDKRGSAEHDTTT